MEGLNSFDTLLENLKREAERLTSTGLSLTTVFAEEANRLNRLDEASRLEGLLSSVRRHLELARQSEDSARYGHNQASLIVSLGGLAVSTIAMLSKNKQLWAFSDHLLKRPVKQLHFGTVLVCIGPKGLPDGVEVVSISLLARESNCQESDIISESHELGYLLLDDSQFSLLIEKLVDDVLKGRVCLPIPMEKLAEIAASRCLKPGADKAK